MMTKLEGWSVVLAPHIRFDLGKLRGGINVGDGCFNACPNMLWRLQDGQIWHWRDLLPAAELAGPQIDACAISRSIFSIILAKASGRCSLP